MDANYRINLILHNQKYNQYLCNNNEAEKDRKFCRHDINHFMDVARLAYIQVLEKNLNYAKDVIYAVALLHDIGRWLQYEDNTPHETASEELAKEILEQSDYNIEEIDVICNAIINHRMINNEDTLNAIINCSDKLSRKCFHCAAIKECNWNEDKKNYNIVS